MPIAIDTMVQVLLRQRFRLVSMASAIVRDVHVADDVFQQVVLSALQHVQDIRDEEHLIAWALRVTRQRAVDHARHRQTQSLSPELLDLLESAWGDPSPSGTTDQVEALRNCVSKLDPQSKELLRLKYQDGLATADLASRFRRSTDAIYQSLSRIHRVLRQCVHRELGVTTAPAAVVSMGSRP